MIARIGKCLRMLFGCSRRSQIVNQAREEHVFASSRNLERINGKVNYLDRLVTKFKEDTRS